MRSDKNGIRVLSGVRPKTAKKLPPTGKATVRVRQGKCPRRLAQLIIKTSGRCWYCGKMICEKTATVDHVLPKAWLGTDDESNLVASCYKCNNTKGDLLLEAYRRYVGGGRHHKFYSERIKQKAPGG